MNGLIFLRIIVSAGRLLEERNGSVTEFPWKVGIFVSILASNLFTRWALVKNKDFTKLYQPI